MKVFEAVTIFNNLKVYKTNFYNDSYNDYKYNYNDSSWNIPNFPLQLNLLIYYLQCNRIVMLDNVGNMNV
ncbi:hypothetical protein T07_1309 [Trichinella nelsoni]|uniref:Uncharacterized protein n=1 Tax=Trichinella nelsoni TaxID=6336 RepID=A0A0V0SIL6_9BILA|nr:hypothetical protein T07_1309 [Trichinella nelsoni]